MGVIRPYTMGDHLGMIEQAAPLEDPHCCEDWDELSSHYHCARCHERVSMMGHIDPDGAFSCETTPKED